jgi:hypothetical protein
MARLLVVTLLLLAAAAPLLAQGSSSRFIVQYKPDELEQVRAEPSAWLAARARSATVCCTVDACEVSNPSCQTKRICQTKQMFLKLA